MDSFGFPQKIQERGFHNCGEHLRFLNFQGLLPFPFVSTLVGHQVFSSSLVLRRGGQARLDMFVSLAFCDRLRVCAGHFSDHFLGLYPRSLVPPQKCLVVEGE